MHGDQDRPFPPDICTEFELVEKCRGGKPFGALEILLWSAIQTARMRCLSTIRDDGRY
jgi:hypothetical protein